MKRIRKPLALGVSLMMAAGLLAGCGGQAGGEKKQPDGQVPETELSAPLTQEKITLTYASWAVGTEEEYNIERRLIDGFMELHPNIQIRLADNIIGADDWNAALSAAAAGGELPDVSMIASLPVAVGNEWAMDVSGFTSQDGDWSKVPDSLAVSGQYGGKQFGIPASMFLAGYFINKDLFEEMNVEPLSFGYGLEEWKQAIAAATNLSQGTVGLMNADFIDWYPYVIDPSVGWFTYDGSDVHLNSEAFKTAVKYSLELKEKNYEFFGLSDAQKEIFGVAGDTEAWQSGEVAMAYDATWLVSGVETLPFSTEFVGLPTGKSVIIPDYAFISQTTEHPREAYEFLKFMTFGKEGILKRLEIVEENNRVVWNSMPLNMDEEITELYFEDYPIEGVREAFSHLNGNSIVEAFKFTPGYESARWTAPTGIKAGDYDNATIGQVLEQCRMGVINIDDYADQLNDSANQYIHEAMESMKEAIDAAGQ